MKVSHLATLMKKLPQNLSSWTTAFLKEPRATTR
jgi:hypothetical protein